MRGWKPGRVGLLVVCLLILIFQPVAGFKVTSVYINPQGSLIQGTPVMVCATLDFSAAHGETFPSGSDLVMLTRLANPEWNYTLILDGMENPRNPIGGRILDLSSLEVSYPAKVDEKIHVILKGTAPDVNETANITLIKIFEEATGRCEWENICPDSTVEYSVLVINPNAFSQEIPEAKEELAAFRIHIEEKDAIGIDTTDAEIKYNNASAKISMAEAIPVGQYYETLSNLTAAHTSINEGETALDKEWAESDVANAQGPIDNTDKVIDWLKGNSSTAIDPALAQVIAKRDTAMNYLSAANDEITNGNYSAARANAQEAYEMGNESYSDALHDRDVSHCLGCNDRWFLISFIASGIGVFVLLIAGIILWKKRPRA